MTRPLSMLIKPASGLCNLRCGYCFYRDEESHSRGLMRPDTADAVIQKAFSYATGPVSFAFQGGEPTLAGLSFFEDFVKRADRENKRGVPVAFSLQTNGLEIDGEFAAFLAEKGFLTGLSVDGTGELHDRHRRGPAGEGSFDRAMEAAARLTELGAEFNILSVVTKSAASQGAKLYEFFKKRGFAFLQFIPCLPGSGKTGEFTPSPAEYKRFLNAVFELWYRDFFAGNYISVRLFDNFARAAAGLRPELCALRGGCANQLVIESDGSVYPCDFYAEEEYLLGNISDSGFAELLAAPAAARFIREGAGLLSPECAGCEFFRLCGGGCRRERDGGGKFIWCGVYREFFRANLRRLAEVGMAALGGGAPCI